LKLLLEKNSSKEEDIGVNDRLYFDLCLYGDDIDGFMKEISTKFDVDLSGLNLNEYFPNERDPIIDWIIK